MPKYNFICNDCNKVCSKNMSVHSFMNEEKECSYCKGKNTSLILKSSISNFVKKTKFEIVQEAKDEAKSISKKIKEGDAGLIRDIYGEE